MVLPSVRSIGRARVRGRLEAGSRRRIDKRELRGRDGHPDHPDGVDETAHSGGEFDEKVRENWRVRVNTPRSGSATVSEKQLKTFALAVLSNPERGRYI